MKRILGLLSLLLFINACDDGNLKVQTIDFSEISAQKCSSKDVIYKVKDNEMLILAIPATSFSFENYNDETPENSPILIPINTTNQVIYRRYSNTVSADNICPTIPSGTPNLTEEWTASSGTIQITSTAIKTTNTTTNATKITGYKYYIVFKNITFQKPSGPQLYETFVFGNYTTPISQLAFNFNTTVDKSTCDNRIFNFHLSEALILDLSTNYSTLIQDVVTTTPRTDVINSSNKLTYKLFSNSITDTYFCTPNPTTPILSQEWNAIDGVTDVSGIIEVSTTTFGSGFQHEIRLKKVSLKRGNSSFYMGDDYLYGYLITP